MPEREKPQFRIERRHVRTHHGGPVTGTCWFVWRGGGQEHHNLAATIHDENLATLVAGAIRLAAASNREEVSHERAS